MPLRESISEIRSATDRLGFFVSKLESWAPQCSEKERIEQIQKEINEMSKKIDNMQSILNSLQKEKK